MIRILCLYEGYNLIIDLMLKMKTRRPLLVGN